VAIIKYISQGGFAHVYTCEINPPFRGQTVACLKRVVVPNKLQLNLLRQEVDAMKRLKGNDHIVSYIDSHASRLVSAEAVGAPTSAQQYEVFLLMEYCSRNGLIDFMNSRLSYKLTEPEILTIMRDVTVGVAMCHHLRPPLLHRDIKIENVLIDSTGSYKLCDFGLAVPYAPVPQTPQELQLLHDDIMHYTTPQYRAPEMIDLTRGFPIDDKLDIWALGCFLYKLCYYTTPFELPGHASMADLERQILHASTTLKIPHDQPGLTFLPRLKNMIRCCLREDPRRRPNAVQLLQEICAMKNEPVPNVLPYTMRDKFSRLEPSLVSHATELQMGHVTAKKEKPKDPFASIDKSKILTTKSDLETKPLHRPHSTYVSASPAKSSPNSRPLSYIDSKSATLLKSFVHSQLGDSTNTHTNDAPGTLEFLRSKEEEHAKSLGLRQNTGGSFRQSWKEGIRRISTGNSSTHSTGNNGSTEKRSAFGSVKRVLTGGSFRRSSTSPDEPELEESSLLIQKRMAKLLNGSNDHKVKKTAEGYGRFTDTKEFVDLDDIDAINRAEATVATPTVKKNYNITRRTIQPPKVPKSLSYENSKVAEAPTPPKKPAKKPPPKPKKPSFLQEKHKRTSVSSDDSLVPDIDDLEKQFAKRFPSYV
jgi:AP2-associated kinase